MVIKSESGKQEFCGKRYPTRKTFSLATIEAIGKIT
jgi:hypothetical protein